MKNLSDNQFIKVINKSLTLPQDCKEARFYTHNYIAPFKKAYMEEAAEYVLRAVDIDDIRGFHKKYFPDAGELLKKSYFLSQKLYDEYRCMLTEAKKIYESHLKDIKLKHIEAGRPIKETLIKIKSDDEN